MPDDDELGLMEEFEWALKDPTEEKVKELGEVVSTITTKLVSAIGDIQELVFQLQTKMNEMDSKFNSLEGKMSRMGTGGPSAPSDAATPSPRDAAETAEPMARAPTPPPTAPTQGGLMGELKAMLAARRKKVDAGEE